MASATKGMTATCTHMLVERGEIDLDAPVAKYWPEFAKHGKEKITLRQVMSHTAGVASTTLEQNLKIEQIADWDYCCNLIIEVPPFWEPGTRYFYHGWTYGHIVDEVIRRATGKTIGTLLRDELGEPFGIDCWIGLPESQEPRVVPQIVKKREGPPLPTLAELAANPAKAVATFLPPGVELPTGFDLKAFPLIGALAVVMAQDGKVAPFFNSREGHACEMPAGNGIGEARGLAKLYAAIISGVDAKPRILKPETVKEISTSHTDGIQAAEPFNFLPDLHPLRFGLGYELHRSGFPMLWEGSFGHSGSGGRLSFGDPKSGFAAGYVCK